jgi:type I pantothenate kinase
VIGMAGSVAVGKSTTARILQALLSRWPNHPRVDRITTDGFLWPLEVLERKGLLGRKGFPESYDRRRLVRFLSDVKAGVAGIEVPVYSHISYDIVPGSYTRIERPDIVIVEGVNVLQTRDAGTRQPHVFVSDFFDFSVYVDADAKVVKSWYVNRFLTFRETAFKRPDAYFRRFSELSDAEARETASTIWEEINAVNLRQNIQPTRERARLVLRKGADHSIERVRLRRL